MKIYFFKRALIILFFTQSIVVFSQDSKALAKIYLLKAQESFKTKDSAATKRYLNKSIQLFGDATPKNLTSFAAKYYALNKNYLKAKKYAELYFKAEKNLDSKEYNEMLLTYVDIEDHINSGEIVEEITITHKEVKKEIPVSVIEVPEKVVNKEQNAEVGKTLRESFRLAKKYFSLKKYAFSKQNLDQFFALKPQEGTRYYKEMMEMKTKLASQVSEKTTSTQELEKTKEEEIPANVPFAIIEEVPIYPGCSGTRKEKATCLNKSLQRHILRKFNVDLANNLGLSSGKKKIWMNFRINKEGNVVDIAARAPHPKLKEEALRVIKLLPKMEPGKQRGKPVGMKYSLPIVFHVEDAVEKETKDN